jgi:3',5'-cyclic AMP phosphodiesterase CpdA
LIVDNTVDPIRIVHVSDLHFGSKGQRPVWDSLKGYLTGTVKPDLMLVTGDIVDSPNEKAFKEAAAELKQAAPACANHQGFYVCPGNHDRYWRGNSLGKFMKAAAGKLGSRKTSSSWFDTHFAGHLVTESPGLIFDPRVGGKGWTLKLVSLDSSRDATFLAQGFIGPETLEGLQKHTDGDAMKKVDLFIALMHHHLLPIPALETATHRFGAAAVKAGTLMDNAGSTLAALMRAQVDVVLHGHEHKRHIARYGALRDELSDLIVVGAGSGTGTDTGKPCKPGLASFNVIELRPDRTVWVTEHRWNGVWGSVAGQDVRLLNQKNRKRAMNPVLARGAVV